MAPDFTETIVLLTKAVAASGTPVPFVSDSVPANYFAIQAKKVGGANVGPVYIGTSAVNKTSSQQIKLNPGDRYVLELPAGVRVNLNTFWIDADNNDDGITGYYIVG